MESVTNAVITYFAAMPGEMRLILGVVIGATFHYMRNRAVVFAETVVGTFIAIIGGFILTYYAAYFLNWNLKEVWALGIVVAFMMNYIVGGLETTGNQIKDSGVKWLIDTAIDSFVSAKEKLGIGKPK